MRQRAAGSATQQAPTWRTSWETCLEPPEHAGLADLLDRSFPRAACGRSWIGARPQLRVIGCHHGRPIAHAGIVRRFLRFPLADDASVLVGDVGLVAVHPDHCRGRFGTALMTTVASVLAGLDLPYGFLTCDDDVRAFYMHCGWHALTDRPVRAVDVHHRIDAGRHHGMLLEVARTVDELPRGPIHRDGQEI